MEPASAADQMGLMQQQTNTNTNKNDTIILIYMIDTIIK
jgi:hypothetical protein